MFTVFRKLFKRKLKKARIKTLEKVKITMSDVLKGNDKENGSLHKAELQDCQREVFQLLELGIDATLISQHGTSILHLACYQLNEEVIDKILEKDVNVNVQDKYGNTPLHILAKTKPPSQISDRCDMLTKIEAIVLRILAKGASLKITNSLGETPLHLAAKRNNNTLIDVFITRDVDINAKNAKGDTALHIIIKLALNYNENISFSEEVVIMLLENGADVNVTDINGKTVLEYVVNSDNVLFRTIFIELLIWGGSLFKPDEEGKPLLNQLIFSCNHLYVKLQKALVEYIIALQCCNFDCKEYSIVESSLDFKNFISPEIAKRQVEKMKKSRFGSYSLFDVFDKYSDPFFVRDVYLEFAVKDAHFQLDMLDYGSLLRAKFKSARKRYNMMIEAHTKFIKVLPNEVVWNVLTLVTDDDLENVLKAIE